MTTINYVKGDATEPIGDGNKVIAHICNDSNKWGAGFVLAISKKWKEPEYEYRRTPNHALGDVTFVNVEKDITVANMIAQRDVFSPDNPVPLRYSALEICLDRINTHCTANNKSLHMPKIGAGLARGNWATIEKIIIKTIDVPVYVYTL